MGCTCDGYDYLDTCLRIRRGIRRNSMSIYVQNLFKTTLFDLVRLDDGRIYAFIADHSVTYLAYPLLKDEVINILVSLMWSGPICVWLSEVPMR